MLKFPGLVVDSRPRHNPVPQGWKITHFMRAALGRSAVTYHNWARGNAVASGFEPSTKKYPGRVAPAWCSAYMQLLCEKHPTHQIVGPRPLVWTRDDRRPFPALVTADDMELLLWRQKFDVSYDEVVEALCLEPAINRQDSVQALGRDPVRWLMLRIMAGDTSCGVEVEPRPAGAPQGGW